MSKKSTAAIPYFLLLIFLVAGIGSYRHYGMSWDEDFQYRQNGHAVWDYIVDGDREIYEQNTEKYHGPAFELVLVAFENLTGVSGLQAIFYQRHLLTFILFWISGVAFFLLLRKHHESVVLISIGIGWYFLIPRIYSDAFYNTKDIPFLSMTMICLYSLYLLIDKKQKHHAIIHGCFCGLLMAIRVIGIMIPAITIGLIGYSLIFSKSEIRKSVVNLMLFLISCIAATIIAWPILWQMPVHHFLAAWKEMSGYPFFHDVLFSGEFIPAPQLPWYYVITWIGITTPLLYLFFMLAGIGFTIPKTISDFRKKEIPFELVYSVIVLLPLAAIWILNGVLYDAWRHLFYIYAPLCLLMVYGLSKTLTIVKTAQSRLLIITTVIVCTLSTGYWMIKWHPYQNVYFNQLAGSDIRSKYEMDYWGLSYREALEKLAAKSDQEQLKIKVENMPGVLNSWILNDTIQNRFAFIDNTDSADFYITNYRWNKNGEPPYEIVDSIVVDGERISGTYRIEK